MYISTAFVNFHRLEHGEVPEEILERNMNYNNLERLKTICLGYGSYELSDRDRLRESKNIDRN